MSAGKRREDRLSFPFPSSLPTSPDPPSPSSSYQCGACVLENCAVRRFGVRSKTYQDQSCTASGSISPLTAKLSSGGDQTDVCLGQGVQHLDPEQESYSCCCSQESGCHHHPHGSF
ncbi:unnamed protein product [Pleuronectes platessa]|uniref:Uncharacterized protein n=1 Tax=Pleuronectes platessa TaxID=8262 RepID=A0A9N7U883_PLEPL|nr:unnamed protein product [Pleuronectes platessa]